MRLVNNCDESEISFENPIVAGYTNGSAPSDNSCHVFHPNGGGVAYISSFDGLNDGAEYAFTSSIRITHIGELHDPPIILVIPNVTENACSEFNQKIGINYIPNDGAANTNFFTLKHTGAFNVHGALGDGMGAGDAIINGRTEACFFEDNTTNERYIYYVLLER